MRIYLLYLIILEEEVAVHVFGLEIEIVIDPRIGHQQETSTAGEDDQQKEELIRCIYGRKVQVGLGRV